MHGKIAEGVLNRFNVKKKIVKDELATESQKKLSQDMAKRFLALRNTVRQKLDAGKIELVIQK